MKLIRLIGVLGAVTATVACAPYLTLPGIQNLDVKLEVTEPTSGNFVLENKSAKNPKCTKFADTDKMREGCVVADLNHIVIADIKLSGSGGWYLKTFRVCPWTDTDNKPANFDTMSCSLSDAQRADWLVINNGVMASPDAQGRVDLVANGGQERKFTLLDLNWVKGTYFYGIEACPKNPKSGSKGEDGCLWTDPGGENYGRGRN